jgi:hypothetical protein
MSGRPVRIWSSTVDRCAWPCRGSGHREQARVGAYSGDGDDEIGADFLGAGGVVTDDDRAAFAALDAAYTGIEV